MTNNPDQPTPPDGSSDSTIPFGETERPAPPVRFDKTDPNGQAKFLLELAARQEADGIADQDQLDAREVAWRENAYKHASSKSPKETGIDK